MVKELTPEKSPLTHLVLGSILKVKIEKDKAGRTRLASVEDYNLLISDPKTFRKLGNYENFSLPEYDLPSALEASPEKYSRKK